MFASHLYCCRAVFVVFLLFVIAALLFSSASPGNDASASVSCVLWDFVRRPPSALLPHPPRNRSSRAVRNITDKHVITEYFVEYVVMAE